MEEMMRMSALALAGCLWLAVQPQSAVARITFYKSIELITAESDAMVRGTIIEIGHLNHDWGYYPYWFKVVIHVVETLKGPKSNEVSVALSSLDPKFELWWKAKTELLFSLRRWVGTQVPCPFALQSGPIELGGSETGVVTLDLRVLMSRGDILRAAREGVAAPPIRGDKKWWRLDPPPSSEVAIRAGINRVVTVLVPMDRRLEERGQRWANSKSADYRALAPRALQPFKSQRNIGILKRLLSDDSHTDIMHARDRGTRYYPARLPAYVILKSWGVPVEEPVTESPLRGPDDLVQGDRKDVPAIEHALDP
jgi:hypothetical protein